MALWGNKDDILSAGTVTLHYAGVSTFLADGVTTKARDAGNTYVYEVSGSIGAGAGTSFGKGAGFAKTGDTIKFGDIIGGTYYGSAVIVGIASTTLLSIGSTGNITGATADLAGVDYTINEQTDYTSYQGRWSQARLSSAETTDAGRVALAHTASVSAASTTLFALDGAYTESYNADGNPRIRVGDTLSTYVSTGSWNSITTLTAIGADKIIKVNTSALTQNAAVGVSTVAISTGGINLGDTFQGNNICTAVNRIGLGTVGFAATIGYGLTSGNVIGFSRTTSNVVTGSASVISIAATDISVRVTRSTGADKVYIGGISTTGTGSAQGTDYEVVHAGWVGVQTYFDGDGNLRVKSETLVAMTGIATGNNPVLGGDPAVS